MKPVSIVVVNYRTENFLPACLESLRKSTSSRELEVVLVDNSRGGGAREIFERHFPEGKLIENAKNLGYSRAVNQGIEASDSEFVFILNPDTVLEENSLDKLLELMREHPEAGIAAPQLLNPDGTVQMSCRRFYTLKTIILRRTFLGKLFKNSPAVKSHLMLDWDHNSTRDVDWVMGAAMLVRRAAIAEVGAMDERFFLYFEDVDWCYRMRVAGWKVFYHPSSRLVHHYRRQSAEARFGKAKRAHIESWIRFSEKWSLVLYLLKRNRETVSRAVLVATDAGVLCMAFYLAYQLRANLRTVLEKPTPAFGVYQSFMLLAVVVGIGAIAYVGLYNKRRVEDWVDLAFEVSKAMVLTSVVLMASTFLLYVKIYSRAAVLMFLPVSIVLLTVERSVLRVVQRRLAVIKVNVRRVLVVGSGETAQRVRRAVNSGVHEGLELAGFLSTEDWTGGTENTRAEPGKIAAVAHSQRAGVIVMADTHQRLRAMWPVLWQLSNQGFSVAVASDLGDLLAEGDRIEEMAGLSFLALRRRPVPGGVLKRFMEIVVCLPALAVYAVPLGVASLGLAIAGRSPVLVEERWMGEKDAEVRVFRLNCGDNSRTGRFLRSTGICWAPLLASVLAAKVALVGVRPRAPGEEPDRAVGGSSRPGLFGLWKLAQGAEEARHSDSEYLARWSHSLDIKTLVRCLLRSK